MIDALQAEHRKVPLPAAVFAAVLRQLQTSTDKTLLRTRDAALAFIIGDTREPAIVIRRPATLPRSCAIPLQ